MSVDKKDVLAKVERAKKVAKRRTRKGGKLRKAGQHWYVLEEYFDENKKEIIGINESGYMLGVLEDFVIVRIPETMPIIEVDALGIRLAEMGIKALIVKEGIRLLRLREVTGEREKKLNAILSQQEELANRQKAVDEMVDCWERRNGEEAASDTGSTDDSKVGNADA
jgi:hypothetical protein